MRERLPCWTGVIILHMALWDKQRIRKRTMYLHFWQLLCQVSARQLIMSCPYLGGEGRVGGGGGGRESERERERKRERKGGRGREREGRVEREGERETETEILALLSLLNPSLSIFTESFHPFCTTRVSLISMNRGT